jgi:histone acetyltransferase HTATIP
LFFVLAEWRNSAWHFCGYFSKVKYADPCNLNCILVMPYLQKRGYGKFLIEFSYELSKIEGRTGSPERPLSDLGYISYVSYWTLKVAQYLLEKTKLKKDTSICLLDITNKTGIHSDDVYYVLDKFKLI